MGSQFTQFGKINTTASAKPSYTQGAHSQLPRAVAPAFRKVRLTAYGYIITEFVWKGEN